MIHAPIAAEFMEIFMASDSKPSGDHAASAPLMAMLPSRAFCAGFAPSLNASVVIGDTLVLVETTSGFTLPFPSTPQILAVSSACRFSRSGSTFGQRHGFQR